eukprot:scpid46536/ scgid33924/ Actin-binding protein anillin
MSSGILSARDNDESGKPQSLAAGVISRSKRATIITSAPDFTPPGKENVALRLAKNNTEMCDTVVEGRGVRATLTDVSPRQGSDLSDNTLDIGFLAENSTASYGSASDTDISPGHKEQIASTENKQVRGSAAAADGGAARVDEEDEDDDDYDDGASGCGGGKMIYQDHSTASPQNINVMTASTAALPAVRKFCTDNAETATVSASGEHCTPTKSTTAMRALRTPVNRHDNTLDSIVPTDIDESFAVGGVGDMPPIGVPSFRRYAELLSPTSNDLSADNLHADIQPYPGTPSPAKRRSPTSRVPADATQASNSRTFDESHIYAQPHRPNSSASFTSCTSSTPSSSIIEHVDDCAPSSKKLCTPIVQKVKQMTSMAESPVAPSAEHKAMMQKIQHLRAVIDRDSTLEKQARQALQHCLARDGGSQQELEAERLMLLAGLRSSRCTSEIERLRQQVAAPVSSRSGTDSPCDTELVLSDICIPLHLSFLSTLGRESVAYFLVVARAGCDVIATTHVQSSLEISGLSGELKFKDQLTLSSVPNGVQVDIELYYMVQSRKGSSGDNDTAPLTPRKRRILGQHGALSKLTPKKQRSSTLSMPGGAALMTRFTLGASCQLPVNFLQTYNSFKMQEWSSHQLLHGSVDVRIAGRPLYSQHYHSAFLTWREEIGGQPNWRRFWCFLDGVVLKAWQYPADQEAEAEPIQTLDLATLHEGDCTLTAAAPNSLVCIRKNSIAINVEGTTTENERFLFFADSKENQALWIAAFQQACLNLATWKTLPR